MKREDTPLIDFVYNQSSKIVLQLNCGLIDERNYKCLH